MTWLKKTVYLTNDPFDPVHQFKSEQQTQVNTRQPSCVLTHPSAEPEALYVLSAILIRNTRLGAI